ncbi:MAG: beta-N-acetylhexosaminidase [Clostridia bacterium]|nr:beta-N-acetylhexosaminidase [Clostridia bacterium]
MDKKINMSVMLDCSRNAVFQPEQVKKFIDYIAKMGYTGLLLYTEDTYEIEGEPYFGHMRGRYTKEELKDIDAYAKSKGVELIPCIQMLGHLGRILRWTEYHKIMDTRDIILVGDDKTYELIDKMFKTASECFTSRKMNIGLDEAHGLGSGGYKARNGIVKASDIMTYHLNRIIKIAEKYGFNLTMWSDMFFKFANKGKYNPDGIDLDLFKQATENLPKTITPCYWDYYTQDINHYDKMFKLHNEYMNNPAFAGGAITWMGYAPNNTFSIDTAKIAMESVVKNDIREVLVTLWGDSGGVCSFYSVLPSLFAYIEFSRNNFDMENIKAKFNEQFGLDWDDFMTLDKPEYVQKSDMGLVNPARYMVYNEFFAGTWDCTVAGGEGAKYEQIAKELKPLIKKNKEFGYIFEMEYNLCKMLAVKYELGVKTREAYRNGDKETLKKLANNEYKKLPKLIETFADSVDKLWHIENKTAGAEIEDLRLGGLARRAKHCRELLLEHVKTGKEIAELKDPMLDFYTDGVKGHRQPIHCCEYDLDFSVNVLMHGRQ